jgi:hypothetical protein
MALALGKSPSRRVKRDLSNGAQGIENEDEDEDEDD